MSLVTYRKAGDRQDGGAWLDPLWASFGASLAVALFSLPPCSFPLCSCPSISEGPWGKPGLLCHSDSIFSLSKSLQKKGPYCWTYPSHTVFEKVLQREGILNFMLLKTVLRGLPVSCLFWLFQLLLFKSQPRKQTGISPGNINMEPSSWNCK